MGYGVLGKVGVGAADPVDELYEMLDGSDITMTEELIAPTGITGALDLPSERTRQGLRRVGGQLIMTPNGAELDAWLPRILGGNESADSFPLADTLPTWYATLDKVTKVFTYDGCVVASAQFQASRGQPLRMTINVLGIDEAVGNSGTFPSLTLNVASGPYVLADLVLSVGGTNYSFSDFTLDINNAPDPERFFNSLTRASLPRADHRTIQWTLATPYGDSSALYGLTHTGVACIATFTNGNRSLVFNSPKVAFPRQTPPFAGKGEIMLPLSGRAYKNGTSPALATTNDSTG